MIKTPKSLVSKIKYIKKLAKMQYHTCYREDDMWVFWVENNKGESLNWTGKTIVDTVNDAFEYIQHEIEVGAIKIEKTQEK